MSSDWESTVYDTPSRTQPIAFETPDHTQVARPTRLCINDLARPSFSDETARSCSSPQMSPAPRRTDLPATPDITPSPSKRWSSPLQINVDEMSPTRSNKRASTSNVFRFGLPSASSSTQDLEEYPFHAQALDSPRIPSSSRFSSPNASPKPDDFPGTIGARRGRRSVSASLPPRSTLRRYTSILVGCMMIFATVRLFPGILGTRGGMNRHQVRYGVYHPRGDARGAHGSSEFGRRRVVSVHATQEPLSPDWKSDAETELLQVEEDVRKGSGWAWRPDVKAQEGLYVLDELELEEDDNDLAFTPSRTEEEYEEIERQINKNNVFSSLTSVQARHSRGRPASRLEGLEVAEILALRRLEERNRVASLRALVSFVGGGAEFPEEWVDEGVQGEAFTAAIESAWTDVDGNGLEVALKKLLGKRAAAEVFPRGWKADVDEHTKLVIFSKSYCPYSRHLRRILDDYDITPSPYYIQVDKREDGPIVQAILQEFTSRFAIPTVLLNSHSIGGADELELAAAEGSLARIFAQEGLKISKRYA